MAGTYSQLYNQIVFSIKSKRCPIPAIKKDELFKYIAGIIRNKGHKPIIVNGMCDHIHIFVGMKPDIAPSDLVRDIKNNSSKFINENKWVKGKFAWQEGYGIFSYSHSQINKVYDYIKNQDEHHKKKTFKEEYLGILKKFDIKYDDRYLFDIED